MLSTKKRSIIIIMTGSSTTSSAWMHLMLLALLIFSSPGHMSPLPREINPLLSTQISGELDALGRCSGGFNKTHQLNISVPQSECPFPYFIAGIKSMNCESMNGESIKILTGNLLRRLKLVNNMCHVYNSSEWTYEPLITPVTPQDFHKNLTTLVQQYKSRNTSWTTLKH